MRNEGVDVFFERMIAVVNTFQSGYHPAEEDQALSGIGDAVQPETHQGEHKGSPLQTDKKTYTTRERGELILNGLPENIYTLSVFIAGKGFVPNAESNISLFGKNPTKRSTEFSGEFLPEYEGHIVKGKIINNQPEYLTASESASEINADVSIMNFAGLSFPTVEGIRFFAGHNSKTVDVQFITSSISGTKEIATVMYQAGEKYRVDILSPFVNRYTPKPMPALRIDSADYGRLLARSVALQVFRYFSEESSENQIVPESHFKMQPTFTYLLDEYTRFTTMREVFIEFITGARFRRRDGKQEMQVLTKRGSYNDYGTMPLVLLDGVPVSNHDVIYNYDPLTVERINIYYGPCLLGKYQFDGIVELNTYRRLHADLNLNRSSQVISYEGPQLPYQFDNPDYSEEKNRQSLIPDSRHTLLWYPNIQPDRIASLRLPFDTSDLTGEFQATVEGVTQDGEIFFATSVFKVEQ